MTSKIVLHIVVEENTLYVLPVLWLVQEKEYTFLKCLLDEL